jgi:hypothetical protein
MLEQSLWQVIVLYLHTVIAYWWALLPGVLIPLTDLINWPLAEDKKINIPPWLKLVVVMGALMVAQFLAYRNSIQNLSVIIEEKKQQSITINSLQDTTTNQNSQTTALKQRVTDLEQAGSRVVTRALPPALSYTIQPLPPQGDNKRVSVEITSNVPLQQPMFAVICDGECTCTPPTLKGIVGTGSARFPADSNVCAFQVRMPVDASMPIELWVLSKNEPRVTAIRRIEEAKRAN